MADVGCRCRVRNRFRCRLGRRLGFIETFGFVGVEADGCSSRVGPAFHYRGSGRCRIGGFLGNGKLLRVLLARRDDHRFLELVLLGVVRRNLVGEAKLVVADRDYIAVLEGMLLDELAVNVGAVGAVEILEERIVEDIDDQ